MTELDVDQSTIVDLPAVDRPSMERWLFNDDAPLSRDEALEVVAKAKGYASSLWRILARAHERRIWEPLGYESFAAFCSAEFDIGKSRSYQLLNLATVAKALSPGDAPDAEPSSADPLPAPTEAHARPMKPIAHDDRAVRTVWARACEIAPAGPTALLVQRIVDEYLNPPAWVPPPTPITASTWWSAGPVWWFWTTPEAGVVLQVGIGNPKSFADYAAQALFTSKPRLGPLDVIAAQDTVGLLPWVIGELLAGGASMPDMTVVEALAHLDLAHDGRGPHELDKADIEMTLVEVIDDDRPGPEPEWTATARSRIEIAIDDFDTALAEYHADKTEATRARVEATRVAAADALAALRDYPDEAHRDLCRAADAFRSELEEHGPVDTVKNGSEDLRRFDQFRRELLLAIDIDDELPPDISERILDKDLVSFNRRTDLPAKHVFPRLQVEDLLDAHQRRLTGDGEVLTGELIQRDTESAGGGGVHAVGAERSTSPASSPAPGPTSPPLDGMPESGDGGAADRPAPPSPPRRVHPDDLVGLADDELLDAVTRAARIGLSTKREDDLLFAAQWLRAAASRFESMRANAAAQGRLDEVAS